MSNETITDIIAEKRARANEIERDVAAKMASGEINQYGREFIADLRREADRLEAAWEREKAEIEASALAAGGMVEASRHKQGGNAAAMREALEAIRDEAYERIIDGLATDADWLYKTAKAALSAPPRNCDVMDWRTAWAKWRTENHPQKPVGYSECYESTTMFMDWYTGTEERKGEGDGK